MIHQAIFRIMRFTTTLLLIISAAGTISAQKTTPGNIIYFDLNSPALNTKARHSVDELLTGHKLSKDQKLLLYGYADYLGTRAHNDSLSTDRAMNVRAYLISNGIPEANITVCVGKGSIGRPSANGQKGYAKDRKVEIITDTVKMKTLTCSPLLKYEALAWSKNASKLKVHASAERVRQVITDNTITISLPGGDKYTGIISKDGQKVNGGTYEWADSERYKGDYKNDKKDGQGIYYWPNGDKLDGTWQADEIIAGTLTIPYDGVMYHSDATHSHSAATYKGSLQYTGAFSKHKFNGHGTAVWPNGDRYDGDWVNDKMSGHGVYYFANGERYDGEWTDNKMNGPGTMYNANSGITMQGTWVNDVFKR